MTENERMLAWNAIFLRAMVSTALITSVAAALLFLAFFLLGGPLSDG